MKRTIFAILLGMTLLPAPGFAHDSRGWDRTDRRVYSESRAAQPGDPGYYCHKHKRKTNKDDTRRHCHSVYNYEHNPDSWRDDRDYSDRGRRSSGRWGWFGN